MIFKDSLQGLSTPFKRFLIKIYLWQKRLALYVARKTIAIIAIDITGVFGGGGHAASTPFPQKRKGVLKMAE